MKRTAYGARSYRSGGTMSKGNGLTSNKGGLKNNGGLAWELVGISRYNLGNRDTAVEAFEKCLDWESTEEDCRRWISHINNEVQFEEDEKRRQEEAERAAIERAAQQEEDVERVLKQRIEAFEGVQQ